jgi:putative salt-induced outer membrane protein
MTMNKAFMYLSASALTLTMALPAIAQDRIVGIDALDDRIEDIERDVSEDMARSEDSSRFGSPEYQEGLSGSASLGYSGKTGNSESQEFALGLRLRHATGPFVQTIGAVLDYADTDGVSTKEDIFVIYDANYYLSDRFYVFGMARLEADGLAATATDIRRDGFVGVGPGYRIVNTEDMAWRVQAGIGVSYLEDGLRESVTETGYIASSRFYYKINESIFLTNDTDVLSSDAALRASNDFGVNLKLTDAISTRVSYLTDYNDSRAIRSDNRVGLSLVMGF